MIGIGQGKPHIALVLEGQGAFATGGHHFPAARHGPTGNHPRGIAQPEDEQALRRAGGHGAFLSIRL